MLEGQSSQWGKVVVLHGNVLTKQHPGATLGFSIHSWKEARTSKINQITEKNEQERRECLKQQIQLQTVNRHHPGEKTHGCLRRGRRPHRHGTAAHVTTQLRRFGRGK